MLEEIRKTVITIVVAIAVAGAALAASASGASAAILAHSAATQTGGPQPVQLSVAREVGSAVRGREYASRSEALKAVGLEQ
jgi:hypothetical protein